MSFERSKTIDKNRAVAPTSRHRTVERRHVAGMSLIIDTKHFFCFFKCNFLSFLPIVIVRSAHWKINILIIKLTSQCYHFYLVEVS